MRPRRIEWNPGDYDWQSAANALARGFAPSIYPCGKCEGPVVRGYVCTHCGDNNPEEAS